VTHHSPPRPALTAGDPGNEVAQLRQVLSLVEEIAGRPAARTSEDALDEAARIGSAYAQALPIVQRRFDGLAAGTAAGAAAGVEALLALQDRQRPARAAAACLADELGKALGRLSAILAV
jgi:hypothetical protein